jgi:hypothetical protein
MDKGIATLLVGLMEVARTDEERAKVDALRERCRKDAGEFHRFLVDEPMISLRLFDLALGKEAVDMSLLKAAEEMGINLDDLQKKPN